MTTEAVITGCLNDIVLALTPVQRWAAAREFNSNFVAERWFILIGIIAMVILTTMLFVVSFNRIRRERKTTEKLFVEYAEKRGLTARDRQILLSIANKAGLKRNESIFTLASAFDRGVAKMKESLAAQQTSEKQASYSRGSPVKSTKLSSRQIPVGKKVRLTRRKARDSGDIESTVIKNSDNELAVRLEKNVTVTFGEFWCVRYYFGSSVWEFDTSVVSYDGNFINRRRFLRVPVKERAFIARFPFERSFIESSHNSEDELVEDHDLAKTSAVWGPPEFVPAVVTELAGPGLRIESSLEVKAGERILVVFNLAQEQDSIPANQGINPATLKIVEDIGEVRHTKRTQNGLSIAVELTMLLR